ncbi:rod shape-determining protein MreC [secondary endosymbiont of Heteropsylla cubana]|uniref:Cell shape-determining protein MreC n=1 Tax=secondary endosymbiont of Heteropsylla cubana TaxID=134287 RepID=J3Z548_9ENTR|nr:rod shape-determining protein MreC [secondary endosymbiont of Heteropsylla cubana]AFP85424.1 rod shape-determining protein MreC [secondary endosymbiont of Heteropsylla cubana]
MKPMFLRPPSLQLRFFLAVMVAITTIIADSHLEVFITLRSYMDTAISPFYFLSNTPRQIFNHLSKIIIPPFRLVLENEALRQELLIKNSDQLLFGQYKKENARLRQLLNSPLKTNEKKIVAQVISITNHPHKEQIVIDKGVDNGVYIGQPVISDKGVIGQVISTSKFTSRVLLICDHSHALPIQVLRNNIRVIVSGNSCRDNLQLERLPINTDIRIGDLLVTSGLGGRFPEGYPVAVVSSVNIDSQRAYMLVRARPTADLRRLHYLLLLWDDKMCDKTHESSDVVNRVANKRLMQIISHLLVSNMTNHTTA